MEQLINTTAIPLPLTALFDLQSIPHPVEGTLHPSLSLLPLTPSSALFPLAYNPTLPYSENLRILSPDESSFLVAALSTDSPALYDLRTLLDEETELLSEEAAGKIIGLMLVKRVPEAIPEEPILESIVEEAGDSTVSEDTEDSPREEPKKRKFGRSSIAPQSFPTGSDSELMHQVITRQIALIDEWKESKITFKTKENFLAQTVEKLNKIAMDAGFEPMMTSNGFAKPKYSSIICKGCKFRALLWFNFKKDGSGEGETVYDIKFFRPPYGLGMHQDVKGHLAIVKRK
ncbi:hypothetical protein FGO68_gene14699 [Halteria grandinella]|uniref:Uncharacterized protein n=1 Tax=Halteria grandinella TaxID=5974 RepID=A0A8J8NKS3_HALGN|nr:hypothetical protein FGO68_gene14699 [Halteria grandinella]